MSCSAKAQLLPLLKELRLPTMRAMVEHSLEQAQQHGWSHQKFLSALLEAEVAERQGRRIERLRNSSNLPHSKTKETLDVTRLPSNVQRQLAALFEGSFVVSKRNVLIFGKPGVGKTHIAAAIGHRLINQGKKVLFTSAAMLVQSLLAQKQCLNLESLLKKLDRFECLIIDDIGYVSQSKDEMEVLFTLLAERYERRSVIITSNLVFSQWDKIFKDPMTTAAAIDRLVHHCTVLDVDSPSFRKEHALQNLNQQQSQQHMGDF